jgi:transposase
MAELGEAVRAAVADGMTEVEAAYVAGVTRMTVRAWLGK